MQKFDWNLLTGIDLDQAYQIVRGLPNPDLVIAPDGNPYLYRWHIFHSDAAKIFFHIQVADDPERPLHDHPWDNFSVILAGGYKEVLSLSEGFPDPGTIVTAQRKPGDVIFRRAAQAHRLFLPSTNKYTMTLFSTGPKVREWGFWYPEGWRPYKEVTRTKDGLSVHINPQGEM